MAEETKYMDLSNMASMPYGPFQPGSGFGVYDNFEEDFGLENFLNQQNKDRVEMAAWQIQKARGLDSVALGEVASIITPYGIGLSVEQLLEVIDEFPGVSAGLNLEIDADILEDADMLYGQKAFNQAYDYLETESASQGVDVNNLNVTNLGKFANWIGKNVYDPLKDVFTTSPEEEFQELAKERNPFGRITMPFGSARTIGGEFEGDEESALEGYLFGKNIFDATAKTINSQQNTDELDRQNLLAEAQLLQTGAVRNETAADIAALSADRASMDSNEQIGLILDDIFAEEGAISLENYISDRSNYDNGELSQDAVREWLGNLGTDVGTTGAAFDTYVGLQQGFDSAFPTTTVSGGPGGAQMTGGQASGGSMGTTTGGTTTGTGSTQGVMGGNVMGSNVGAGTTGATTTGTGTPSTTVFNDNINQSGGLITTNPVKQPGEEGFIPTNIDEWELNENIKRVRREEQEALLNTYVDSQASLGDYYEGDPFYAGMTTDALDDGESDTPMAISPDRATQRPSTQGPMSGNVMGTTTSDDGSIGIIPSQQTGMNPYQAQFQGTTGQASAQDVENLMQASFDADAYKDPSDLYSAEEQLRQYIMGQTAPGSRLRDAVWSMRDPLLQQYYLTGEGIDPRYAGGTGVRRTFADFMKGPQLTGQQLRNLAQETTGYLGLSGDELYDRFGQGMTNQDLARISSLQQTYGGKAGQGNRLALATALATQRGDGGFYGGRLGQAIGSTLGELQAAYQSRNPFGGDAGNFLNYYLQQTNRKPQTQMGGI
tara:strand:- start:135 stop:2456 length:2322 start_codon:yes stop_codon:yes gene_type:complete